VESEQVPEDEALEELEMAARVEKRGLWADPHPRSRRGSGGREINKA